jgi:hypothetical protein
MNSVLRFPLVPLVVAALAGCAAKPPEIVTEVSPNDRSPLGGRYQREGDTLVIFPRNRPYFALMGAEVEVIGGDVYLDPINRYGAGPARVEVDLSGPSIPSDWSRRLYWINSAEFDPLKLLRRTKIFRTPIPVEEGREAEGR